MQNITEWPAHEDYRPVLHHKKKGSSERWNNLVEVTGHPKHKSFCAQSRVQLQGIVDSTWKETQEEGTCLLWLMWQKKMTEGDVFSAFTTAALILLWWAFCYWSWSEGAEASCNGTFKTVSQNQPSLFMSWLSLVFVIVTEIWLTWCDFLGFYTMIVSAIW